MKSLLKIDTKAKIPPHKSKEHYVGVWRNWERPAFSEVEIVLLPVCLGGRNWLQIGRCGIGGWGQVQSVVTEQDEFAWIL